MERHGLFVIIALGETLIVAGAGLTEEGWSANLIAVAVFAVAITCALWWTYFTKAQPALERTLTTLQGNEQAAVARESFTLLHFPMMVGVILHAYAIEEVVAHPAEPLSLALRLALAAGAVLFVGGMGAALWRGTDRLPWSRFLLTLVTASAVLGVTDVTPLVTLVVVFVGVATVALVEQRTLSP